MTAVASTNDLLQVDDLVVGFRNGGDNRDVVKGVSFGVSAGRCLAIVGESGSGKSVTARTLVGLTGRHNRVQAGRMELDGESLLGLGDRQWRRLRGKQIGVVLQDALVSLDSLRAVGREIAEPLRLHHWGDRKARRERVIELLREVGVPSPSCGHGSFPTSSRVGFASGP